MGLNLSAAKLSRGAAAGLVRRAVEDTRQLGGDAIMVRGHRRNAVSTSDPRRQTSRLRGAHCRGRPSIGPPVVAADAVKVPGSLCGRWPAKRQLCRRGTLL